MATECRQATVRGCQDGKWKVRGQVHALFPDWASGRHVRIGTGLEAYDAVAASDAKYASLGDGRCGSVVEGYRPTGDGPRLRSGWLGWGGPDPDVTRSP